MLSQSEILAQWRDLSGRAEIQSEPPPLQRPRLLLPGLRARPWWDAASFTWMAAFTPQIEPIRQECLRLIEQGDLIPRRISDVPPAERQGDQALIDGEEGGWDVWWLVHHGQWIPRNCERCPATTAAFESIPGRAGTIGFAVMLPGTHLVPHCGLTNAKLRAHLGIGIPSGCSMRVGDEIGTWRERGWIVFDDSFEHEVWHRGDAVRSVLMVDLYHPDLRPEEIAWLEQLAARITV